MATTGSSQTSQDKGASKIKKGAAARIQRDNDIDNERNRATHQESRDRDEHRHFHAADTQDIERSQSSARAQKREKGWEDKDSGRENWRGETAADRNYTHSDYSHYNDDSRAYQSFSRSGGNRSSGSRYVQMGHGANRRPDDGYGDPMNEVDRRYLSHERDSSGARPDDRRWREDDRRHYDGNRSEHDRDDLNDRQNGWQANVRVDNRDDERRHPDDRRFHNNWRDRQWHETAYRSGAHEWRPNDDWRNEQRNGSEYDRDRGSYGNSRFRDDDYGYRASRPDERDYGHEDDRSDPRQPRGYSATSERDFEDRNPSREWERNPTHTGRGRRS